MALWDNQLRMNHKAAVELSDSVHRLYHNQQQLLKDCDKIEAYQVRRCDVCVVHGVTNIRI